MKSIGSRLAPPIAALLGMMAVAALAAPEFNPVHSHNVAIGPEAARVIVGFRTTADNAITKAVKSRVRAEIVNVTQARTSRADLDALVLRSGVVMRASRQITPSMHVLILRNTLYGADVEAMLNNLRSDAAVAFAEVDERRYAHSVPNDPLFLPSATASGQWFMQTPNSTTATSDSAATDAVSAWNISQGSSGTVIADVDNGVRFDHPDLLRAGFGGRLLPGYDFVGQDVDASDSAPQGSFLIANDGDGWDPDPSDPGDWIDSSDLGNASVFPSKNCSTEPSSWHGTRVMGLLGALTNNDAGVAGMSWNPYLLPVRALGKCGGLDSDIMAGIIWAAGLTVTDDQGAAIPDNPYPADIINLSLGGTGSCPSSYASLVKQLSGLGVLIVASAGNESGPVDIPANCPGVLGVAGLRNIGTKVGYSSLGPEVGIAAPAGNCVTTVAGQPCLRSIDTTTNLGQTVPGTSGYTDQNNSNLGTSFSAPIVSGVAALMRAVNGNLTPPQLIARIKASSTPFPQPSGLALCVANSTSSVECACTTNTCGAGMVNALNAVKAAQNPIAAIKIPAGFVAGSGSFDASGSIAACGASLATYAWSKTGGVTIVSAANAALVHVTSSGTAGTLKLVVTDSLGNSDTAVVAFNSSGASTAAPASAGDSAAACVAPMIVAPVAPTVTEAFSPASVGVNSGATLSVTLNNANGFVLTQSGIVLTLPEGLDLAGAAPSSTCTGANLTLTSGAGKVTLANANIAAKGTCSIAIGVKSAAPGSYTSAIPANALMTGPAGANAAPASADLVVTAATPTPGSTPTGAGGGGGGAFDWLDIMLVAGIFLVIRGHASRVSRQQPAKSRGRRR